MTKSTNIPTITFLGISPSLLYLHIFVYSGKIINRLAVCGNLQMFKSEFQINSFYLSSEISTLPSDIQQGIFLNQQFTLNLHISL